MDIAGKGGTETMYFRCRKEAALHNDRLNSRAGAAEALGISESSLAKHELGIGLCGANLRPLRSPHRGRQREQCPRHWWSVHVQREQCPVERELEQRLRPILFKKEPFNPNALHNPHPLVKIARYRAGIVGRW